MGWVCIDRAAKPIGSTTEGPMHELPLGSAASAILSSSLISSPSTSLSPITRSFVSVIVVTPSLMPTDGRPVADGNRVKGCGIGAVAGAGITIGVMSTIGIAAVVGVCLYRRGLRTGERNGHRQALRAVFPNG